MIYVTGDCHQDFSKFSMKNFPDQKSLTKDDFVIVCGDFGGIFSTDATLRSENHILDELDARSFTTLFVDGNHENFDRLNSYPIEEWNGGNIHKIRDVVNGRFCPQSVRSFCPVVAGFNAGTYKVPACVL